MTRMYAGEWTGTMALTEPQAGSSLADVTTRATPTRRRRLPRSRGAKIFISGGDHDLTDNIVHMTLARIDGAPAGIKGVSLFAVPKRRFDERRHARRQRRAASPASSTRSAGAACPSVVLSYGERGDCRGWLVGEPHQGIRYMFQMMNEARIMVGLNGVATASVAYHESLAYARTRTQGRPAAARDRRAAGPDHRARRRAPHAACARRRSSKAASRSSPPPRCTPTSPRTADDAERSAPQLLARSAHAGRQELPRRAGLRVERARRADPRRLRLLARVSCPRRGCAIRSSTASTRARPASRASISSAARSSPTAGARFGIFLDEVRRHARARARRRRRRRPVRRHAATRSACSPRPPRRWPRAALDGDVDGMLLHSADYLALFSIVAIAWQWLLQAAVAAEAHRARRHPARLLRRQARRRALLDHDRAAARRRARRAVQVGRAIVRRHAQRVVLID